MLTDSGQEPPLLLARHEGLQRTKKTPGDARLLKTPAHCHGKNQARWGKTAGKKASPTPTGKKRNESMGANTCHYFLLFFKADFCIVWERCLWNNWQLCAWHKGTELSGGDHLPSLGQSRALVIFSSPSSPIAYNRVTDKIVGGFFTLALGRGFQLSATVLQNSSTILGWKVTLHPATQN